MVIMQKVLMDLLSIYNTFCIKTLKSQNCMSIKTQKNLSSGCNFDISALNK